MLFNSISYLIFIFICSVIFYASTYNIRKIILLIFSCFFYSLWSIEFLLIIIIATYTDYYLAILIDKSNSNPQRLRLLSISIFINLSILIYFKYLFFITDNIFNLLSIININIKINYWQIILPLGISFYTFESISYIVDVYRRQYKAEEKYLSYIIFIMFFPKLIAGPIMRASKIIPQFSIYYKMNYIDLWFALKRISLGLFLKVFIADNISTLVDDAFSSDLNSLSAIDVWTVSFCFGFQIYLDFAAYSSIAIGTARLFGIHVNENFNFPYISCSPREFWHRWHISLSEWVRDYVYIPLSGENYVHKSNSENIKDNKINKLKFYSLISLVISWIIMGLWHGANWTFVLWGLMHAIYIIINRILNYFLYNIKSKYISFVGWLLTLPAIMLAWIPFRAPSLESSFVLLSKVININSYFQLGLRENIYLVTAILLSCHILLYFYTNKYCRYNKLILININYMLLFITSLIVLPINFIFLRPINQFIYFQF